MFLVRLWLGLLLFPGAVYDLWILGALIVDVHPLPSSFLLQWVVFFQKGALEVISEAGVLQIVLSKAVDDLLLVAPLAC